MIQCSSSPHVYVNILKLISFVWNYGIWADTLKYLANHDLSQIPARVMCDNVPGLTDFLDKKLRLWMGLILHCRCDHHQCSYSCYH